MLPASVDVWLVRLIIHQFRLSRLGACRTTGARQCPLSAYPVSLNNEADNRVAADGEISEGPTAYHPLGVGMRDNGYMQLAVQHSLALVHIRCFKGTHRERANLQTPLVGRSVD